MMIRIFLLAMVCFSAPACQPASKTNPIAPISSGSHFKLRPVETQKVTFNRSYYSLDQVDQRPGPGVGGTKTPRPRYPTELREAGVSGEINLAVAIDEKGNVSEIQTIAASDERFAESAKEAIKGWKFKPARKDGKPVGVWLSVPMKFALH